MTRSRTPEGIKRVAERKGCAMCTEEFLQGQTIVKEQRPTRRTFENGKWLMKNETWRYHERCWQDAAEFNKLVLDAHTYHKGMMGLIRKLQNVR